MVDPKDIPDELIDASLANYQKPDDPLGKNGILEQLSKRVVERALQAEMTSHLGHEKHGKVTNDAGNIVFLRSCGICGAGCQRADALS